MIDSFIDDILKDDTLKINSIDYFSDKKLSCQVISQGTLLPYNGPANGRTKGGIVDADWDYIDSSALYENDGCGYSVKSEEVVKVNKDAIYLGMWFPIWGHSITDSLKKLWFLKTEQAQKLINDGADLVYIITMNNRFQLSENFVCLLKSLNIDIAQLKQINEPTQYNHVYIPDNSFFREHNQIFYTKEFEDTRNNIIDNTPLCKCPVYDRIYFSRSKFKNGKHDFGEKRIEDVFRYLKYKIIYPERLSFAEQVHLLRNCTHFAATEGSTSHNSLFCRPKTKVEIIRKGLYLNEYQPTINALCNLNAVYIDSNLSLFTDKNRVWNGPFFLYANDNLLRFAGIPLIFNNFSLKDFKRYACLAYPKNKENTQITEFYSRRLIDEINMSYFCKGIIKRIAHNFLSHCNLSIWVPVYKKLFLK
ncbi:MAG: glycosyltransferase family 61 protein [Salinivirgaceae bacterium]|nr:glycosyltransferase family 61 protein [Salinivirgaceae bacterium]